MKAIWSGTIGFGLVNIPVKLYSASQRSELSLDMLDAKDHERIHFKRVNERTGREVDYSRIVKGYKYKGDYVIIEDGDFKKASPEKSSVIELEEFVNAADIDSIYFEQPYYLAPGKAAGKPYALLRESLKKSDKVGVGTFVLRNKQHVCILKPMESVIVLNTIRYEEEIRATSDLTIPKVKLTTAEMKMARTLIDQLSVPLNLKKYKDTYSADLVKLVHAKAKGKEPKTTPSEMKVTHRKNDDLMAQLKASLRKVS